LVGQIVRGPEPRNDDDQPVVADKGLSETIDSVPPGVVLLAPRRDTLERRRRTEIAVRLDHVYAGVVFAAFTGSGEDPHFTATWGEHQRLRTAPPEQQRGQFVAFALGHQRIRAVVDERLDRGLAFCLALLEGWGRRHLRRTLPARNQQRHGNQCCDSDHAADPKPGRAHEEP
jgi:hypothetical protein